jgi:hypothetical protein
MRLRNVCFVRRRGAHSHKHIFRYCVEQIHHQRLSHFRWPLLKVKMMHCLHLNTHRTKSMRRALLGALRLCFMVFCLVHDLWDTYEIDSIACPSL